jgi:hypothetical protein
MNLPDDMKKSCAPIKNRSLGGANYSGANYVAPNMTLSQWWMPMILRLRVDCKGFLPNGFFLTEQLRERRGGGGVSPRMVGRNFVNKKKKSGHR